MEMMKHMYTLILVVVKYDISFAGYANARNMSLFHRILYISCSLFYIIKLILSRSFKELYTQYNIKITC